MAPRACALGAEGRRSAADALDWLERRHDNAPRVSFAAACLGATALGAAVLDLLAALPQQGGGDNAALLSHVWSTLSAPDFLLAGESRPVVVATVGAIAVGCIFAREASSQPRLLLLLLAVSHTWCLSLGDHAAEWLQREALGWRRTLLHCAASAVALLAASLVGWLRTLIALCRWSAALRHAESSGRHREPILGPGRKVLILYANVGSGHKRAAQALEAALFAKNAPKGSVAVTDVMDLCTPALRFVMQTLFQELTQSLAGQHALGFLYDSADRGVAKSRIQRFLEEACLRKLLDHLAAFDPDEVVCTHFLPAQAICSLRKVSQTAGRRFGLSEVLTDLDLQFLWVQPEIDTYFLPRPDVEVVLRSYGNFGARVTGIPIMPAFAEAAKMSRDEALAEFSLAEDAGVDPPRPLVLVMSGGKLISEIYSEVLEASTSMRVVVVMGRQADIRDALAALPVPSRHRVTLLGFVDRMPQLLRCADLLVGKSGGLTIAEAAVFGVPMVIMDPIPGQETRNADVLLEVGAAVKINDLPLLHHRLDELLTDGGSRIRRMGERIATLGKADAAADIAEMLLQGRTRPPSAE